jgi:hypothetical protein
MAYPTHEPTQKLPDKVWSRQYGNAALSCLLTYGSRLTTVKATRLSVLMAFESSIVGLEIPTSGADRATVT